MEKSETSWFIVDEIIIVDTGSTDETLFVARQYTSLIFHFSWQDDFSLARNFALEKASKDWVLIIDADERLTSSSHKALRQLLQATPPDIPQVFNFLAVASNQQPLFTRALFPRLSGFCFKGRVHETLRFNGQIPKQFHCSNIRYEHVVSQANKSLQKQKHYLQLLQLELEQPLPAWERVNYLQHLANAYQELGYCAQALDALEEAYLLFKQTAYFNTDLFYLNLLKNLVMLCLSQYPLKPIQALIYAKEMTTLFPELSESWMCYAQTCFTNQRYLSALSILDDFLSSSRNLSIVLHHSALLLEARCWIGLSEFNTAHTLLKKLYQANPVDEVGLFLHFVNILLKNTSELCHELKSFKKLTPFEASLLKKFI